MNEDRAHASAPAALADPALAAAPPEGIVRWHDDHDRLPRRLVVEDRRPLILAGHAATSTRSGARNAHRAAESLARTAGLDATSALPGETSPARGS